MRLKYQIPMMFTGIYVKAQETLQSVTDRGYYMYKPQNTLNTFGGNANFGVLSSFSSDANGTITLLAHKTLSNYTALALNNSFDLFTYNNYLGWKRFMSHNSTQDYAISLMPDGGKIGLGTSAPLKALQIGNFSDGNSNNQILIPGTYNFEQMRLGQTGNGNMAMEFVNHNGYSTSYGMRLLVDVDSGAPGLQIQSSSAKSNYEDMSYSTVMHLSWWGTVGIGVLNPTEKLEVSGKIRAKEIKVETANWPDYVFQKDYKLPGLSEIEKHIQEKGHLPGMPNAKEAETNGIELGEINKKLLQKVEELTLYMIELKKENEKIKETNVKLADEVSKIQKKLNKLN